MDKFPKVGIGVFIIKDNKILMGKRKGSHGEGSWSLPGGHLEYKESIEKCAIREVEEETGLRIKNITFQTITNDIFEKEDKHYITIFVKGDYTEGTPEIKEPQKCEKWEWFEWNTLPSPLFTPIQNLLKQEFNPLN